MLILHETYDHWSVAVVTVTVHDSFFPTFDFFHICCLLHWIEYANLHFLSPYLIMDLPIFTIAEWATLLVDIHCPRGGSELSSPIHFSGLAALMSADIAQNL